MRTHVSKVSRHWKDYYRNSVGHKSHVKNRNKKITLVEKIAKIAKQDNVLDCIDLAQKAEAIEVDVKKIRLDS